VLFVVLADGADFSAELAARVKAAIATQASPRHVPDDVIALPALPHTRTGKRLEVRPPRLNPTVSPNDSQVARQSDRADHEDERVAGLPGVVAVNGPQGHTEQEDGSLLLVTWDYGCGRAKAFTWNAPALSARVLSWSRCETF
jgi:AMP-binding enzyme C-terminal domain